MTVPMHPRRQLRARDLPDLTTDDGPFTSLERHLIAEVTRDRFRAEPDTTPEPQPNAELFWMVVAVAFIALAIVFGFLLGVTSGQGLR